ncbi:MAG: hypothetical protein V7720_17445 [Halioglobus sp.]
MTVRIAMWSGPRNISTALMRSWENRADCSVVDEPFYAAYLADTCLDHPCREQILLSQSTDYRKVIEELKRCPTDTPLQYQKQMTHHIPRGMNMDWCDGMKHCFLIRDPAQVIASYVQKMPTVDENAIGISRQVELFEQIKNISGTVPTVIDSNDVLKSPGKILGQLCTALGIEFREQEMLHWPTGRRNSDGIWADHWYHNVDKSTGFAPHNALEPELNDEHRKLADTMKAHYEKLAAERIRP